mmetsp:Transcript_15580/g.26437  ORF Transcript_15580/g.26437 Transcript_15580/m.26437 type:complete len:212 (+) Transcript_15580:315-950(+)
MVQRCSTDELLLRMQVSTFVQKESDHLSISFGDTVMQGSITIVVGRFDIGTTTQQLVDHLQMALSHGMMQRHLSCLVRHVNAVRLGALDLAHRVDVAGFGGQVNITTKWSRVLAFLCRRLSGRGPSRARWEPSGAPRHGRARGVVIARDARDGTRECTECTGQTLSGLWIHRSRDARHHEGPRHRHRRCVGGPGDLSWRSNIGKDVLLLHR